MRTLLLTSLSCWLALGAAASALQDPGSRRGSTPPPVIRRNDPVKPAEKPVQAPAGGVNRPEALQFGGGQAAANDPSAPRAIPPNAPRPFSTDRPVLEVDGVPITSSEINDLVAYYHSFRPGSVDVLLRDAVSALVPRAVMQARYADALDSMKSRIDEARAKLAVDNDFAAVVAEYSDDEEAPTLDGSYVFGREAAVQPFDMHSHTGPIQELEGPFLTRYGYHVLQVTAYEQGATPQEDKTTVRHVLAMFPFQGDDPRAEIDSAVSSCSIRVLEPGLRNIVAPELRARIAD